MEGWITANRKKLFVVLLNVNPNSRWCNGERKHVTCSGLRTFPIHLSLQHSVLRQLENYQNRIDDIFIPDALLMVKAVGTMRGVSSSKAFRGRISGWQQTCKHKTYFPHIDTRGETLLANLKEVVATNFTSKKKWRGGKIICHWHSRQGGRQSDSGRWR